MAIEFGKKRRRKVMRALIAALTLWFLWYVGSGIGGLFGFRPPLIVFQPQYALVIREVENGTLKPDEKSTVRLPWGVASPDGRVFVERKPDGRLFVLFPTWYGRLPDLQGYLWCSQPLHASDFHDVDWGAGGIQHALNICGQKLLSAGHMRGQWWWVDRRLE